MAEIFQNSNQIKIYSSKEEELEEVKQGKKNEKEDKFQIKILWSKLRIIIISFFLLI